MSKEHFEILVEEPSTEAVLRELLPRIIGETSFEVYSHQCKDELLKRLPARLQGYAQWLPPDWCIVVILDRDDDDCLELKETLEGMAARAGLATRTNPRNQQFAVINRLAIEELEAWFFGDWQAVKAAYTKVNVNVPSSAKYRFPDEILGGTWEAFERVMQRAGYFKTGLRKIEAAREIARFMDPGRNTSRSFQVFRDALLDAIAP